MGYFGLVLMFNDGRVERICVKRVTNLSTTKCKEPYLYYEHPTDVRGKGTTLKLADLQCWECETL